jgi:hypothetical protein
VQANAGGWYASAAFLYVCFVFVVFWFAACVFCSGLCRAGGGQVGGVRPYSTVQAAAVLPLQALWAQQVMCSCTSMTITTCA